MQRPQVPGEPTASPEELREMLRQMRELSTAFYATSQRIGCHAFLEFTGLMNEFIQVCQMTLEDGVNFNECNTHSGQALTMHEHNARYLAEKLDCIFGPTLRSNKTVKTAFMQAMGFIPEQAQHPVMEDRASLAMLTLVAAHPLGYLPVAHAKSIASVHVWSSLIERGYVTAEVMGSAGPCYAITVQGQKVLRRVTQLRSA